MCACINARSIVSADKILCCINTLVTISYNPRARVLCESGGGRPGLPSLTVLNVVSVDVKQHFEEEDSSQS